MKSKLNPIEKFKPLWEGGKSVEQYNIKVGFKIRMFCVNELNGLRQKNPALFGQKETEELTKMIMDLKQDKGTISLEDQNCNLEDYQQFLSEFFQKVDYEDRHGTVTVKTSSKFRVMASFIDVLSSWGPIDPEMQKCKKYCQFKAVDIFKALKKGEVPKRGGPKEQENAQGGDAGLGNEIEELSKNMDNTTLGNNGPMPGSNDQQFTSYHSGGNNPYVGQGQQFNQGGNNQYGNQYGGNMNNSHNSGFSNPFGGSNNNSTNNNFNNSHNQGYNNYNQQQQQQHHHQQPSSQPNSQPKYQNPNQFNYQPTTGNSGMTKPRKSKVFPSLDKNPRKRRFEGKYELNANIPIKYNTVDYFMLVENVRINNSNALRELKRGKASDILNSVMDSLEFLSYIHK
jgi:hypothetical protein